jgi:hypothetical protein
VAAASLTLSPETLREIGEATGRVEVKGDRYAPAAMAMVGR